MQQEISAALRVDYRDDIIGDERLPSRFAVSDMAACAISAVGGALAMLVEALGLARERPAVKIDRRLASLWYGFSIHPIGWALPPIWDAVAGDYQTSDGWIKLHTNLPHHRKAALTVLECAAERNNVAAAIKTWKARDLERAIVAAGGVAAAMRTRAEWSAHPQGKAVASEPLIAWDDARQGHMRVWNASRERPLTGLRVLDLTRVLAGPVATRTLAGFGADVLRVDPPGWEEANIVPDITLGKRCSRLDLNEAADRNVFEKLLSEADVLVHGYRKGALEGLGYGEAVRRALAPNLLEVKLNAYGWTGPWARRRGFDSLVQMSCGIADEGMRWAQQNKPTPLPVQALDHATGYLMAAAVLSALGAAVKGEGVSNAQLSLARTAELLMAHPQNKAAALSMAPDAKDFSPVIEQTPWGPAHRLNPPLSLEGTLMKWALPASALGASPAVWG